MRIWILMALALSAGAEAATSKGEWPDRQRAAMTAFGEIATGLEAQYSAVPFRLKPLYLFDYPAEPERGAFGDGGEAVETMLSYAWIRQSKDNPLNDIVEGYLPRLMRATPILNKPPPQYFLGQGTIEQGASVDYHDPGHNDEELSFMPTLAQLYFGQPRYIETMVRAIWNMNDNMHLKGFQGATNWAQYNPDLDAWMFLSCRNNANGHGYQFASTNFRQHDAAANYKLVTPPGMGLAWYYGFNHYFFRDDGRNTDYLIGRDKVWLDRSVNPLGSGPYAKRAYEIPNHILPDGTVMFNPDAHSDKTAPSWGWELCATKGWPHWSQGYDFYFHAAMYVALAQHDQNPQVTAMLEDLDKIMALGYCERAQGRGQPVYGDKYTVEQAFAYWRQHRPDGPVVNPLDPSEDCDQALFDTKTFRADSVRRSLAASIYMDRGEHGKAVAEIAEGLDDAMLEAQAILADYQASGGNPEIVKHEEQDGYMTLSQCGGGSRENGPSTAYWRVSSSSGQQLAIMCLDAKPNQTKLMIERGVVSDSEVFFQLMRGFPGAVTITVGPDANYDGVHDSVRVTHANTLRRGETWAIPSFTDGTNMELIIIDHLDTVMPDYATMPDPAINNDRQFDFAVSHRNRTTMKYTVSFKIHNLGLVAACGIPVALYLSDGTLAGPIQTIDLPAFTGMDPAIKIIQWEVDDPSALGKLVIDPNDIIEEIAEVNNQLGL